MDAPAWQRVSEIFDQVVDLPASGRGAVLDALCAGDADLRRNIETMLAASAGQAEFEKSVNTARLELATQWSLDWEVETGIAGGERIGAWRIVREIARGGMGVVLLAERADGQFEQRAALKLLAYPTMGLMERFRHERQILARLDHPNIARLIDGGLSPSRVPYFVMEHVEGVPIIAYCREAKLGLAARLGLFTAVCDAVQYAHRNLVVHRDLKPSNILVGSDERPKLLDFGVAKLLAPDGEKGATPTAMQLLTPDYAAPEQLRGEVVTTATDVYSLGVILHELLTGVRPRQVAHAHWSVVRAAFDGNLPGPSSLPASDELTLPMRRAIRGDLDRIVLKALSTTPERRYSSAAALAEDLGNHLAGRPVTAAPDHWSYRCRKFVKRHRVSVIATILVMATAIAGVCGIVWQAQKTREQALHASAEARNAIEQAHRADAVREFLIGVLDQAKPDATQGKPILAHDLLDRAVARLEENVDVPNAVRADVLDILGKLYFDMGDYERAEVLLKQAIAKSGSGTPSQVRARALLDLAGTTWRKGAYPLAREYLHSSLALAPTSGRENEQLVSDIRHMLDAVEVEANGATAEPVVRDTLRYDQKYFGEDSEQVERDWETLAWVLLRGRKYEETESAIDHALAIAREHHGEQHSTVASALEALAYVHAANLDLAVAEQTFARALEMDRQILGPNHPDTLRIQAGLLSVIADQGRFAEALPLHVVNIARQRDVFGNDSSSVALAYTNIGETQRELGQFAAAEDSLREARRIWTKIDNDNSPELANVLTDIGSVFFLEGRYRDAEASLRDALVIARKYFPDESLRVRRTQFWLAKALTRGGAGAEAIDLLGPIASTLATKPKSRSPAEHYDLQYSLNILAEAQLALHRTEEALISAQKANELGNGLFPKGNYRFGTSLLLMGLAKMEEGRYGEAESAFREALAVRGVYVATDPRLIEVKLALTEALLQQGKKREARAFAGSIPALLAGSAYPCDVELRAKAMELLGRATNP